MNNSQVISQILVACNLLCNKPEVLVLKKLNIIFILLKKSLIVQLLISSIKVMNTI